jgi:hypothetical protein
MGYGIQGLVCGGGMELRASCVCMCVTGMEPRVSCMLHIHPTLNLLIFFEIHRVFVPAVLSAQSVLSSFQTPTPNFPSPFPWPPIRSGHILP